MELNFLPQKYQNSLSKIKNINVSEIRLRRGFPVILNSTWERSYLSVDGLTNNKERALICTETDIVDVINNLTEYSVYAFNDMIKMGFLVYKGGVRIGICGECVTENGQVVTIKNISSLNIRVPNLIENCSGKLFEYIYQGNQINNSLIISPPTFGKTTMLKDIALKIDSLNKYSILLLDERGEFDLVNGGNIDKIRYSSKLYGLEYGIRTLSPSIVITDELSSKDDWVCALRAVTGGVKIISTCHAGTVFDLRRKSNFIDGVFDRYFVLKEKGILGGVFDEGFNEI